MLGFLAGPSLAPAEDRDIRPACALVIGIGEYLHWDRRPTARDEAGRLASVLGQKYGYGDIRLLLDGRATRRAILDELQSLARLGESDGILVCFVGHGARNEALDEGFWIPADARRDDDSGWIAHSDVFRAIRATRARHVAVISNCRIGNSFLVQSRTAPAPTAPQASGYPAMAEPPGRWILCDAEVSPSPTRVASLITVLLARMDAGSSIVSLRELAMSMDADTAGNRPAPPALHGGIRDPAHAGGAFVFFRRTQEGDRIGGGTGETARSSNTGATGAATGRPTPRPVPPALSSTGTLLPIRYPVRDGESIETIAKGFLRTPESLRDYNGLRKDQDVEPGMILLIPIVDMEVEAPSPPLPAPPPTVVSRGPADKNQPAIRYPVSVGESLEMIAKGFLCTPESLRNYNGLRKDQDVAPGMILLIPIVDRKIDAPPAPLPAPPPTVVSRGPADKNQPAIRYTVSEGETVETIARAFQLSPTDVRRFNRMAEGAVPAVNSILYLPDRERSPPR